MTDVLLLAQEKDSKTLSKFCKWLLVVVTELYKKRGVYKTARELGKMVVPHEQRYGPICSVCFCDVNC